MQISTFCTNIYFSRFWRVFGDARLLLKHTNPIQKKPTKTMLFSKFDFKIYFWRYERFAVPTIIKKGLAQKVSLEIEFRKKHLLRLLFLNRITMFQK